MTNPNEIGTLSVIGSVAQRTEPWAFNPSDVGKNPTAPTTVSNAKRASGWVVNSVLEDSSSSGTANNLERAL